MTTGLVFTLSATCSDFRGSSRDQAIKLRTCTATANRLLVDISKHASQIGHRFCNHYSYSLKFVNCLKIKAWLERSEPARLRRRRPAAPPPDVRRGSASPAQAKYEGLRPSCGPSPNQGRSPFYSGLHRGEAEPRRTSGSEAPDLR